VHNLLEGTLLLESVFDLGAEAERKKWAARRPPRPPTTRLEPMPPPPDAARLAIMNESIQWLHGEPHSSRQLGPGVGLY